MDTLARPDDNPPDLEAATPYFRRRQVFDQAVDEAAPWYAGGLGPDPLAA